MYKIRLLFFITLLLSAFFASTTIIRPNGQGIYMGLASVGPGFDCKASIEKDWNCVDEAGVSTKDFINGAFLRYNISTFKFDNVEIPRSLVIRSVTLTYYARRSISDACFQTVLVSNLNNPINATYNGTIICPTSGWKYHKEEFTTNPFTGNPWDISEVNALEAGLRGYETKLISGQLALSGSNIAQIYAVVDYKQIKTKKASNKKTILLE